MVYDVIFVLPADQVPGSAAVSACGFSDDQLGFQSDDAPLPVRIFHPFVQKMHRLISHIIFWKIDA